MIIRKLGPGDDLAAATGLLQCFFAEESFTTSAETIAARVQTLSSLDTCALLVAEEHGRAVGVATISCEFGIEFGWWAEMGDLYVVPELRGNGIARALVTGIEDWLRHRGIAGYQVTVTPRGEDQHGLMAYYRLLGFSTEGRLLLFKDV